MLVARSFTHGHTRARDNSTEKASDAVKSNSLPTAKNEWKKFGWRPNSYTTQSTPVFANATPIDTARDQACSTSYREGQKRLAASASDPQQFHTAPMTVPQRQPSQRYIHTHSRPHTRRQISDTQHDAESVPASVAALLAMTKIPRRTTFSRSAKTSSSIPKIMSMDDLAEYWRQMDDESTASINSRNTLEFLLSPPDTEGPEILVGSEGSAGLYARSRTTSSDSMPSLEFEVGSYSSCDTPSAPETFSYRLNLSNRKVASPPKQLGDNHPLSADNSDTDDDEDVVSVVRIPHALASRKPLPKRTTSSRFKSNLTASISALRSAARSFSNFAAASVPPENYISSGFLGPRFPNEMRPNPVSGTPTPQLRRYLNPLQHNRLSPQELHLHDSHLDHTDLVVAAASTPPQAVPPAANTTAMMIPMQTYASAHASIPDFSRPCSPARASRHREPRENPEFLRICVLEMAMRRAGKLEALSAASPEPLLHLGRKAFWLPPRQDDDGESDDEERAARDDEVLGRRIKVTAEGGCAVRERRGGLDDAERNVPRRWRALRV